jgi:hypothetical protein
MSAQPETTLADGPRGYLQPVMRRPARAARRFLGSTRAEREEILARQRARTAGVDSVIRFWTAIRLRRGRESLLSD